MSEATKPKNILRTAALSLWGLLTLILLFTLAMVFYDQYQRGQNPLAFAVDQSEIAVQQPLSADAIVTSATEVPIYFASPNSLFVRPENRKLSLSSSTVQNCREALKRIIEGPESSTLIPVVSNKTEVRAMYLLENGELIIDFSRSLEAGHINSATAELLMIRSITQTLFQDSLRGERDLAVRSIRFLFEGAPYQHSFPAHIDLSDPVERSATPGASVEPA